MKYGLEQEFFVAKKGVNPYEFVGGLDASLTPDGCGFLAEARGQPFTSIREAVFSLMADVHRLEQAAERLGLQLVMLPSVKLPLAVVQASRRRYAKERLTYQNLYGHEHHKNPGRKTAGIHISFTDPREHHFSDGRTFQWNGMFDYVQVFRKLDSFFEKEIRESGRRPGFYELKMDGRIEYRSLPNTVDLLRIIECLDSK